MIDVRSQFVKPQGHATHTKAQQIGIAVHHSVTGDNFTEAATQAQEIAHLKVIEDYHINNPATQYGLFGYHFAAFPSGRLYYIGSILGQRAGVAQRNHEITSVVAIGTFTNREPGQKQLAAIGEAIRITRAEVGKYLPVRGHNTWAVPGWATACAGRLNAYTEARWDEIASASPEQPFTFTREQGLWAISALAWNYGLQKFDPNASPGDLHGFDKRVLHEIARDL